MPARAGLDRSAVIEAAARLLDDAGDRPVTLGEIATHLGVRTPSLYNHIEGQDDLRRGLALLGVRELGARIARAAVGKAGDDAIRAIGDAYRAFAKERPGLYRTTLRAPEQDDLALQAASEEILTVLRLVLEPYALSDADQVHAIRGFRSLVHGFVSLELDGGFGLPVDLDESFARLMGLYLLGLRRHTEERTNVSEQDDGAERPRSGQRS